MHVRLLEHHCPECIACDVTLRILLCCAGSLLSVIGRILHFFVLASEARMVYAMFGCKFTPGVKHSITHSQMPRFFEVYIFKSAEDQMVSTPIQLEYAVCILVTP